MKTTTLFILSSLISYGIWAQTNLDELLIRYENIPPNGNAISAFFNPEELAVLRAHFNSSASITSDTRGSSVSVFGNNSTLNSVVSFTTDTPENPTIIGGNSGSADFEGAGDIDPFTLESAYVLTLASGEFYEVDLATANYTLLGNITPPNDEQWNGLEFDPATGLLYAISSNFTNSSTLSIIDIENQIVNPIGPTGISGAIAIATDGVGNFYTYDIVDDNFYSIDESTGLATLIGPIGFNANFGQDLEWDSNSGVLFMTAFNVDSDSGELRIVDTSTGSSTFLGFPGGVGDQIAWVSIQNESTLSTEDFNSLSLTVYPNPSKGFLNIQGDRLIQTIDIYDVNGRLIQEAEINNTTTTLDIQNLKEGIYFVNITVPNESKVLRFVKQ